MSFQTVLRREVCPRCSASGRDNNGDNLIVYDDHSHCFSCGLTFGERSKGKRRESAVKIKELEVVAIASRGISEDVCSKYGVGIDEKDNLCFPYTVDGHVTAYKCRPLDEDGLTRNFTWCGDSSNTWWFGRNICPSGASTLILCEGETDTLATVEAHRFENKPPCVLGLSKGASSALNAVKRELEYIRKFRKVVVMFDSDAAGQEATDAVLAVLPMGRSYVAYLPTGIKDASMCLVEIGQKQLVDVVSSAVKVSPKSIVNKQDLVRDSLDFFFNREAILGHSTGYPGLDYLIGGYGEGSVVTIVGDTGTGKTTFATQLASLAANPAHRVAWIPLEMTPRHQALKFAEFELQQSILQELEHPNVSHQQLKVALETVSESVLFYNHFGAIDRDALREFIEVIVDSEDVKLVVLDHLSAATQGGDWKEVESMIATIKEIALNKRICIVVLAHVTIDKAEDKNGATRLKMGHIRGGKSIGHYSDVVLGLERDRKSSEILCRTLKLHRVIGRYGELVFEYNSGRYEELGMLDDDGMVQPIQKRDAQNRDNYNTVEVLPTHHEIKGKPVQMVFPLKMHGESNPLPVNTTIEAMRGYGRCHTTRTYEPYKAYGFKEGDIGLAVSGDKQVAFRVGKQYHITRDMVEDTDYQNYWANMEKHSSTELLTFLNKPEVWGLHMTPLGDYVDGAVKEFGVTHGTKEKTFRARARLPQKVSEVELRDAEVVNDDTDDVYTGLHRSAKPRATETKPTEARRRQVISRRTGRVRSGDEGILPTTGQTETERVPETISGHRRGGSRVSKFRLGDIESTS